MSTRLSISTPVVTMFPQTCGEWEKQASIDDLAQIAEAAEANRRTTNTRISFDMGALSD